MTTITRSEDYKYYFSQILCNNKEKIAQSPFLLESSILRIIHNAPSIHVSIFYIEKKSSASRTEIEKCLEASKKIIKSSISRDYPIFIENNIYIRLLDVWTSFRDECYRRF